MEPFLPPQTCRTSRHPTVSLRSSFDVEAFSLWAASYMLSYHGAPGLRSNLQRQPWSPGRAREQFVAMVRNLLQGAMASG